MESQTRILFVNSFILFLVGLISFAQAPNIEWEVNLGGSEEDWGRNVRQTNDGGYIVVGTSRSNNGDVGGNNGDRDYWVVKLDATGVIQWETNLGGSDDEWAYAIRQTTDDGYVIAGYSHSNDYDVGGNNGNMDVWVVKLDVNGVLQWEHNYGGSGNDTAFSIEQTTDGGFIVAGQTNSSDGDVGGNPGFSPDYWVLKLDQQGILQWENNYGGNSPDWADSIQQTSDGGYIVAGSSTSNNGDVGGNYGLFDYWLVKLDPIGNIQWEQNYGGGNIDQAKSVKQTTDGGYIVGGTSWSNNVDVGGNNGLADYWVIKLDSIGNIQWEQNYGGNRQDWGQEIQQTFDGGYVITGTTWSIDGDVSANPAFNSWSFWVVKIDNIGNLEWERAMGGSFQDQSHSIQQTNDSGYIVTGRVSSNNGDVGGNPAGHDYWVVKLEGEDSLWPRTYGGAIAGGQYRKADDIVVDDEDNVYTIGILYPQDKSHQSSSFLSAGYGYLMKHDSDGNLVWVEYFPSNIYDVVNDVSSQLEIVNDKLIILTNIQYLLGYDTDGNSDFIYQVGPSIHHDKQLSVDSQTGDIYVGAGFSDNFTAQNNDYTVTASNSSPKYGIFKFNPDGSHNSHHIIEFSGSNFIIGYDIYDLEFSESLNKVFVSGHTNHTATFAPGQSLTDMYFGIEYNASGLISYTQVTQFLNPIGLLAHDNLSDKLYVSRGPTIVLFSGGFTGGQFPLNLNYSDGYRHFYFHQSSQELYIATGPPNVHPPTSIQSFAKVDSNGLVWDIPLPSPVFAGAIVKGANDYVYTCGHYFDDASLGAFPIFAYDNPTSSDIYISRIEDQGASAEFKIGEEVSRFQPKESRFILYPNPADNLLYVEAKAGIKAESLAVTSITGNKILTIKNSDKKTSWPIDITSVSSGVYFVQITTEKGEVEVYKVIKR